MIGLPVPPPALMRKGRARLFCSLSFDTAEGAPRDGSPSRCVAALLDLCAGIVVFDDVITTVSENTVSGNANAFSGIAVVGVHNAIITDNHVGGDPYGITLYTLTGDPNSDGNTISNNEIFGSGADGIAVCGDNNLMQGNTISGSTHSAVKLVTGATFGAQCTSNNNRVTDNRINGACTGVLVDPAASSNTIGGDNRMFNAVRHSSDRNYLHLAGDDQLEHSPENRAQVSSFESPMKKVASLSFGSLHSCFTCSQTRS